MRWTCIRCSVEYEERPAACGLCFVSDHLAPLPILPMRVGVRAVASGPRRRAGLVRAGDLQVEHRAAAYGPPWNVWAFGEPHGIELRGPPGGGKSTLATRLAVSAARRVPVLYVAAEEGHSRSMQDRLQRAGLDDLSARRLRISDARHLVELDEDVRAVGSGVLVIVDSVTELQATPASLESTLQGHSWIVISRLNARGLSAGGNGWTSAADVSIDVEDGIGTPTKNRFGPKNAVRVWEVEDV